MTVNVISRAQWGATAWKGTVNRVAMSEKDNFLVHYHGGKPAAQRGVNVPRNVEKIHLANGWTGIGYNFLVDLDGKVYEGRGWDGVGAQCPGYNRSGIGVYVAVGEDQKPTDAALNAVVDIYEEAVKRRGGAAMRKMRHCDGIATSCCGPVLGPWVLDGMPRPAGSTPPAAPKPSTPAKPAKLKEDGLNGPSTRKAVQKMVGVTQDGEWGPRTRRAIQKWVGVTQDGNLGPVSRKAVQRKVGAKVTGIWNWDQSTKSDPTTKALQVYINKHL